MYEGRPVFFTVSGPWTERTPASAAPVSRSTAMIALIATVVVLPGMIVGAALAARANLRHGRGDRRLVRPFGKPASQTRVAVVELFVRLTRNPLVIVLRIMR